MLSLMRRIARKIARMLQKWFPSLYDWLKFHYKLQKNYEIQKKGKRTLLTYHERPLYSEDVNTWSDKLRQDPKCAIVLQGPIITEHDFTLNTLRIYKKHF